MKFKTRKILIICLVATLAISMISAVSAEVESGEIIVDPKIPGDLERSVNTAYDGETLLLKNGVYTIDKKLAIYSDIKFKGGSNVIFEGKGKGQIYITSLVSKGVSFEKITFKNFKKSAIYTAKDGNGKLTVSKCKFTNNSADIGGAIDGVNLRINDCTFTNNKAGLGGGAISSENLVIKNCAFTKNQANDGGAIFSCHVTMNKCTFTSNQAKSSGGAIFVSDSVKPSKITNSKFTKDSAKVLGGAIYTAAKMNVNKCTFTSNKASFECGGAIWIDKSKTTIVNSKFNKNIAGKKYNAIEGKVTLKNVKISPKDGTKVKK